MQFEPGQKDRFFRLRSGPFEGPANVKPPALPEVPDLPTEAQVVFDHVQARLRFQADVFWTKTSIDQQVLRLWLDTYQVGKDFKRRGIVEVSVA
jgi:hypothetical protein